jgi:hypothetical protein
MIYVPLFLCAMAFWRVFISSSFNNSNVNGSYFFHCELILQCSHNFGILVSPFKTATHAITGDSSNTIERAKLTFDKGDILNFLTPRRRNV